MKTSHFLNLGRLDLRLNPDILDRTQLLTESLRNDLIPHELRTKANGCLRSGPGGNPFLFTPHPQIHPLIHALRSHHSGVRRLRNPDSPELIAYALSYFWQDNDYLPDSGPDGLSDDWTVINRIMFHVKREMDDFRLWSARRRIENAWYRGKT